MSLYSLHFLAILVLFDASFGMQNVRISCVLHVEGVIFKCSSCVRCGAAVSYSYRRVHVWHWCCCQLLLPQGACVALVWICSCPFRTMNPRTCCWHLHSACHRSLFATLCARGTTATWLGWHSTSAASSFVSLFLSVFCCQCGLKQSQTQPVSCLQLTAHCNEATASSDPAHLRCTFAVWYQLWL